MQLRPVDIISGFAIGLGTFGAVSDPKGAWVIFAIAGMMGVIVSTIATFKQ